MILKKLLKLGVQIIAILFLAFMMVLGVLLVFQLILILIGNNLAGNKDVDPTIIAVLAAAIVGFLSVIITNYSTTQREIASRHYRYKLESYQIIINLLFDIIQKTKGMKEIKDTELNERMLEFKKNLLLQGNIKMIQKWSEFETLGQSMNSFEIILLFDEIYQLIREDLGHKDRGIKKGDLAGLVLGKEAKEELSQYMKNKK